MVVNILGDVVTHVNKINEEEYEYFVVEESERRRANILHKFPQVLNKHDNINQWVFILLENHKVTLKLNLKTSQVSTK